ncbi:hypothetical protein [Streptomyces sp. NBC_01530]|uniref:hypothetical protein n=1 Tax=Streptomyces sp. NBC_01530 TaxID=2903895 RepID=UPI00386A898A
MARTLKQLYQAGGTDRDFAILFAALSCHGGDWDKAGDHWRVYLAEALNEGKEWDRIRGRTRKNFAETWARTQLDRLARNERICGVPKRLWSS